MNHMTKLPGVPDASAAKPGMAFFEGSGPFDKTCGDCALRGYSRRSAVAHWDERLRQDVYRSYRVAGCAMFKMLAGHHGPAVDVSWRACKYFEPKVSK